MDTSEATTYNLAPQEEKETKNWRGQKEASNINDQKFIPYSHPQIEPLKNDIDHSQDSTEDMSEDELAVQQCHWGPLKPNICQKFRSPKWVLFWLCWAGALQGFVVNGLVSVVLSSIERRFDLPSTVSGTVFSCYDIASVICLIPVSYFGGFGSKPRWLGWGIIIMGLGSFLFALPHFTTGLYEFASEVEASTCAALQPNATDTCDSSNGVKSLSNYKYVFIFANLLHGVGATPLYTLGVTYLDENLKPKLTSLYVGIFYSCTIIGPAIAFLGGGQLLNIYTDFESVDAQMLGQKPGGPTWVGAWWVGFLISGVLSLIVGFFLLGFPKELPGSAQLRSMRVSESYKGSEGVKPESTGVKSLKALPRAVKILISNPTFMFLNIAGASEGLLLSGFTAFAPKFVENQFSLSSSWAAMVVGIAAVPAGGGGTFLGGYIVKRFNLKCIGIIRLCLASCILAALFCLVFLVQCVNMPFAGVSTGYLNSPLATDSVFLNSSCNLDCHCTKEKYELLCGIDNVMYYSPCYAGCSNGSVIKEDGSELKVYGDCTCLSHMNTSWTSGALSYQLKSGKCETNCNLLYIFLPLFAFLMLFTFIATMPALSATLRCVPESQKSFALGLQWLLMRCLGTIPAGILFGALIDRTCQFWQTSCGEQGSCHVYDNNEMSTSLLILAACGKVVSILCFVLALCLYRPPPTPKSSPSEVTQDTVPSPHSETNSTAVLVSNTNLRSNNNGEKSSV